MRIEKCFNELYLYPYLLTRCVTSRTCKLIGDLFMTEITTQQQYFMLFLSYRILYYKKLPVTLEVLKMMRYAKDILGCDELCLWSRFEILMLAYEVHINNDIYVWFSFNTHVSSPCKT